MHPATAHALRSLGGWDAACHWETDKLNWRKREFISLWVLAQESGASFELVAWPEMARLAPATAALDAVLAKTRELVRGKGPIIPPPMSAAL